MSYPKAKQDWACMTVHATEKKTVEIFPPEDDLDGIIVCD